MNISAFMHTVIRSLLPRCNAHEFNTNKCKKQADFCACKSNKNNNRPTRFGTSNANNRSRKTKTKAFAHTYTYKQTCMRKRFINTQTIVHKHLKGQSHTHLHTYLYIGMQKRVLCTN